MTLTRDHLAAVLAAFAPEGIDLGWLKLRLPAFIQPAVHWDQAGVVVVDLSETPLPLDPDVPLLGKLGKRIVRAQITKATFDRYGVTVEGEVTLFLGVVKSFKKIVGVQS